MNIWQGGDGGGGDGDDGDDGDGGDKVVIVVKVVRNLWVNIGSPGHINSLQDHLVYNLFEQGCI